LLCRLSRYYCRKNPLQECGEGAANLAEDLKTIVKKVKENVMNPGCISLYPIYSITADVIRQTGS
jgi:hypothetical protein